MICQSAPSQPMSATRFVSGFVGRTSVTRDYDAFRRFFSTAMPTAPRANRLSEAGSGIDNGVVIGPPATVLYPIWYRYAVALGPLANCAETDALPMPVKGVYTFTPISAHP